MNNSNFRAVHYRSNMSQVTKLIDDLEQVGHIVAVDNVVSRETSTCIVTFADGRTTRIVYKRSFNDRMFGGAE